MVGLFPDFLLNGGRGGCFPSHGRHMPSPPPRNMTAEKDKEIREKQEALERQRSEAAQDRIRHQMELTRAKAEADAQNHRSTIELLTKQQEREEEWHTENMKREQMHHDAIENLNRENTKRADAEREAYQEKMSEMDRNSRQREEKAQQEKEEGLRKATEMLMENQEKCHAEMSRTREESQKQRELLIKEQQQAMTQKEKDANDKLEKISQNFNERIETERTTAKDREEKIRLEKRAMEEQYRKDLSDNRNQTAEERRKHADDYQAMIERKDNELNDHLRNANDKMDAIRRENNLEVDKVRQELDAERKKKEEEIKRLYDLRVKDSQDFTAERNKLYERMIQQAHESAMSKVANAHAITGLLSAKVSMELEFVGAMEKNKENTPLKEQKKELTVLIQKCNDSWMNLIEASQEQDAESLENIQSQIKKEAKIFRDRVNETRVMILKATHLENMNEWKKHLDEIEVCMRSYSKGVIMIKTASASRLEELSELCEELHRLVVNLPEVHIEDLRKIIGEDTRAMIENSRLAEAAHLEAARRAAEELKKIEYEKPHTENNK